MAGTLIDRLVLRTFPRGGIHPPEAKDRSAKSPIAEMGIPAEVAIPTSQHLGAPGTPLVKKGDTVRTGQPIAASDRPVSAVVHSSVTGKVTAIGDAPHPNGPLTLAITIKTEPTDEWAEGLDPARDPVDPPALERRELLDRIKAAGLVGLGGAAFPTHIKLAPPPDKKIDTVIFNGAECEPFLTADHRLMLERPKQIVAGCRIVAQILGVQRSVIAVEANKPDAVEVLREQLTGVSGFELVVCETKYPQGGEKQLIKAITGREVPSRGLPMDVGLMVHNLGTCAAIYEAVARRRPLIDRVVTVSGPGIAEPRNLLIRVGTRFSDVLAHVGCTVRDGTKVVMGGPMMGRAVWSLDAPVVKGTSGILVFPPENYEVPVERPCVRCGKCVEACPMGLLPVQLASKTAAGLYEELADLGIFDCMECGSCAYVCGSRRNLVQWFRIGKLEAAKLEKKKA